MSDFDQLDKWIDKNAPGLNKKVLHTHINEVKGDNSNTVEHNSLEEFTSDEIGEIVTKVKSGYIPKLTLNATLLGQTTEQSGYCNDISLQEKSALITYGTLSTIIAFEFNNGFNGSVEASLEEAYLITNNTLTNVKSDLTINSLKVELIKV